MDDGLFSLSRKLNFFGADFLITWSLSMVEVGTDDIPDLGKTIVSESHFLRLSAQKPCIDSPPSSCSSNWVKSNSTRSSDNSAVIQRIYVIPFFALKHLLRCVTKSLQYLGPGRLSGSCKEMLLEVVPSVRYLQNTPRLSKPKMRSQGNSVILLERKTKQ